MSEENVYRLNLNLLLALHALLQEGHVTRAAERMGITQSAMSRNLAQLRRQLDDPLLVRTGNGMHPTERAQALRGPLERWVADAEALVGQRTRFEPLNARLRLTVASSDHVQASLLPRLMLALAEEAPGLDLVFRTDGPRVAEQLVDGSIDLALAPGGRMEGAELHAQRVMRDDFRVVHRAGHAWEELELDLDLYCEAKHALAAPLQVEGGLVDDLLRRRNRSRRVALVAPSFLSVGHLVATSDLVSTLPTRVAEHLAQTLGLVVRTPPLELPSFSLVQYWHTRQHANPAHVWFRQLVHRVGSESLPPT